MHTQLELVNTKGCNSEHFDLETVPGELKEM